MMLSVLVSAVMTSHGPANLLVNGDFTMGNKGFQTGYTLGDKVEETGTFAIGPNPHDYHPDGFSMGDHSGAQRPMMILNGSEKPDVTVWQERVKVSPHRGYSFTGWSASWGEGGDAGDPSPARLRIYINGVKTGDDFRLAAKDGAWQKFVFTWKSGKVKTATIRIVDSNTEGMGNDFAIGDLSFHRR